MMLIVVLLLHFQVLAQDKANLLAQYKAEVQHQAGNYPIAINERNVLRAGYIENDTNVFEIQVVDRSASEINAEERTKIEKQLNETLGALYCRDGTNESIPRTLGLSIEYRYFDKLLAPFQSVTFSQENCDKALVSAPPKRTEQEVRVQMQIRGLQQIGTGSVNVCREHYYNGHVSIIYSNEIGETAIFLASDEYAVNIITIRLGKEEIVEFGTLINEAETKAARVPNLENVNLGKYNSGTGNVKLFGQKGNLKGYFTTNLGVDSVILNIDAKKINYCLSQITPFL
jgi:hypothetical protein